MRLVMFQSLLWWNTSTECSQMTRRIHEKWSFNPCCGGILLLRLDARIAQEIVNVFQSLLWWNTSTEPPFGFWPVGRFFEFQSLLWWNTSTESPTELGVIVRGEFQSLLWWNTSTECILTILRMAYTKFQSLLWWNTSTEDTSGEGECVGYVTVSILVVVEYFY